MATINYNFGAPSIKKFHELFEGENLITFIDITGFDVIKFDEYMLAKHEDYVDGISLKDFLTDKYTDSVADIERALALEPRHFAALGGLGQICLRAGDVELAAAAFDAAVTLNPSLTALRTAIAKLDGRRSSAH